MSFFRFFKDRIEELTTAELEALDSPVIGKVYLDTTLGYNVFYNGTVWKAL